MKKQLLIFIIIITTPCLIFSQVGIGTNNPKGLLDINSNQYGVVYPNVTLTDTSIEAPIVNPNGGDAIVAGTTVYNNNTTNTGNNDVQPGIYVWNGTKWITQSYKRQVELFKQTNDVRPMSNVGWEEVTGIGASDNLSFTARYTGKYKIEVKVNYGGGDMIDNGDMNTAYQSGTFQFNFNGNVYPISVNSISTYNAHISGGTNYSDINKESYINLYVTLTAGTSYPFYLEFDQNASPGFINNGDSGNGRGYINSNNPCLVEFTFIDE